jgi:hypothetical protein
MKGMKGVQFMIDEEGKKKAVVIDLSVHGDMWEDFYDAVIAKQRENEPFESWDEVKKKVFGDEQ